NQGVRDCPALAARPRRFSRQQDRGMAVATTLTPSRGCRPAALACAALAWAWTTAAAAEPPSPPVEFNRDIRPVLSDTCFQCHGPDKARRKAKLRLDTEEGAFADLGGYRALVPGDLARSELFARITAGDVKRRMPPEGSGRRLTPHQIELIRRWIEQGAKWQ